MNLMETETFDKVDLNKKSFDNNNDLKKLNQNMDTSTSSQTLSKCSTNDNSFKCYTNSIESLTATKSTNNNNSNIKLDFYKNLSSSGNAKDIQKNDQSATNARSNTFTFLNRQKKSVSIPSKVISDINQINKYPSQHSIMKKESLNNHLYKNYYQSIQFYSSKEDITDDVNNVVNESAFKYDIRYDTNNCNNLNMNELKNESLNIDNATIPETINIIDKIKKTNEHLSRYCDTKKLFCRNADQENAFRRIEDVHNYAKHNHFNYSNSMNISSSNSSNQDDDDDDDDDEEVDDEDDVNEDESDDAEVANYTNNNDDKIVNRRFHVTKENEPIKFKKTCPKKDHRVTAGGKKIKQKQLSVCHKNCDQMITNSLLTKIDDNSTLTPDHHARRPMNAFLIFCKRHRSIVREKYKNLENRSITKVLGDWWASLDIYDKDCYTLLAKQYKDAFFNANPNFKWYKLPAPPLRTLNTRPSNGERFLDLPSSEFEQLDIDKNNQWNNNAHLNPDVSDSSIIGRNVNVFKLADETQLGGLSILLNKRKSDYKHSMQTSTGLQKQIAYVNNPVDNVSNESCGEPFENMRDHAMKMLKNENTIKGEQSFSSSEDDNLSIIEKTTSRSCKGKKYKEFISSGQIGVVAKKPKIEKMSKNKTNKSDSSSGDSSDQKPITQKKQTVAPPIFVTAKDSKTILPSPESPSKFNTISFDLEEKINSLPALNLEEYLQRKRNTKTKKKTSVKRRIATPAVAKTIFNQQCTKTAQEVKESLQIVGSKKRKARKESITRRDQNDTNIIKNVVFDLIPKQFEPTNDNITATVLAASHCNTNNDNINNNNNSSTSDLLILAEVATNHFEIK